MDWPDTEIGHEQLDKFFIVETKNTAFAKELFSGDTMRYMKKNFKYISEIKLEDGELSLSVVGIYFAGDRYKYLLESFSAILNNYTAYEGR